MVFHRLSSGNSWILQKWSWLPAKSRVSRGLNRMWILADSIPKHKCHFSQHLQWLPVTVTTIKAEDLHWIVALACSETNSSSTGSWTGSEFCPGSPVAILFQLVSILPHAVTFIAPLREIGQGKQKPNQMYNHSKVKSLQRWAHGAKKGCLRKQMANRDFPGDKVGEGLCTLGPAVPDPPPQ